MFEVHKNTTALELRAFISLRNMLIRMYHDRFSCLKHFTLCHMSHYKYTSGARFIKIL